MSAWIICATFCSRVSLCSRSEIRVSMRESLGTLASAADAMATRRAACRDCGAGANGCDTGGEGCESRAGSAGRTLPNAAMTPQQDIRATGTSQRVTAGLGEWIIFSTYLKRRLAPDKMYRGQDFPTCQSGVWRRLAAIRGNETCNTRRSEADLHAYSIGPRRVEDELLR